MKQLFNSTAGSHTLKISRQRLVTQQFRNFFMQQLFWSCVWCIELHNIKSKFFTYKMCCCCFPC